MFISALFALVAATPEIKFPFNDQLPPVARYGQQYEYTLNPDTFSSDETITLSCPDLPSWLSFDASTASFSGSAPSTSQGDQRLNFTILAADSMGTVVSDCYLELIDSVTPNATVPLVDILREVGPTSDPNSLVLSPGEDFEIEFPDDFFTSDGRTVIGHYSVTNEHAPLPIWLHFDGNSRKYWGTAPQVNSEIAQAEDYDILYIQSTVQGFSTAQVSFNLLVGAHAFSTNLTTQQVNVTQGEFFTYQIPTNEIYLNNHSVTPANISQMQVSDVPSWLSWASDNYTLSGTPSDGTANKSFAIPVTVSDLFNDSVQFTLSLEVQPMENTTVFRSSSIGPINATEGQFFSYSLKDSLVNDNVDISIDSDQDWISYHSSNYSIQGQTPDKFNGTTITLHASVQSSKAKRDTGTTAEITLVGVSPSITFTSSQTSSSTATSSATSQASTTATSTTTTAASSTAAANSTKTNHKKLGLICGLAIPLGLLFILAIIFLILFCRRRRNRRQYGQNSPKSTLAEKGVSAPILIKSDDSPAFTSQEAPPSLHTGDEHTMVDTPEVQKEDPTDWTTPQRVSAFNFLQMDGADAPRSHDSQDNSAPGIVAADSSKAAAITAPIAVGAMHPNKSKQGSAVAAETEEQAFNNVPRASWRHTNLTDRRWQDNRMSYNSLASVADGQGQIYPAGHSNRLPRDGSSGIVHRMGSGLSSPDQSMQFNSTVVEEDNASSDYHTASSGDEAEEPFNGDSSPEITPYKNEQGGFEFRQMPKEDSTPRAQLRNSDYVISKPQKVGHATHNSQSGELAFI